jgi:hypothetical protein
MTESMMENFFSFLSDRTIEGIIEDFDRRFDIADQESKDNHNTMALRDYLEDMLKKALMIYLNRSIVRSDVIYKRCLLLLKRKDVELITIEYNRTKLSFKIK